MTRRTTLALALWLSTALGCAGATTPIRRAAGRGDLAGAMRLYDEYVEERGDGDPDLLAEVALAVIREAAASGDHRARSAGFSALRGLAQGGHEVLEALARREGVVGDRAAAMLYEADGRRGDPPARLRAALRSADPERRTAGLVAVRGVARLVRLARESDPQVRAAVARELARRRGNAPAAAALAAMAREDADPTVRSAAVMALGAHGREQAGVLRAALEDRDPIVRMTAPSALAAAAPDEAAAALEALFDGEFSNLSLEAARVLATRGNARAEEHVLRALREARRDLRAQAAVAAGSLPDARSGELAAFLRDPDPEVSIRVAGLLSRREAHREAALAALRPLAAGVDGFVAVRALGALAAAGDTSVKEPLRQALASSDANVRRLAVLAWPQAIGSQGGDVDPLGPLLRDPDRSVALLAAMQIVLIAAR